jgi:hypothetical protein
VPPQAAGLMTARAAGPTRFGGTLSLLASARAACTAVHWFDHQRRYFRCDFPSSDISQRVGASGAWI